MWRDSLDLALSLLTALLLSSAFMLTGCPTSGTDCEQDADCFVGEVCSSGTCVLSSPAGDMLSGDDGAPDSKDMPGEDMPAPPEEMGAAGDMDMPDPVEDMSDMPHDMPVIEDMPVDMPPATAPEIQAPTSLVFPRTSPLAASNQVFAIENIGDAPLTLTSIALAANTGPFTLSFPDPANASDPSMDASVAPTMIAANASLDVRVTFDPQTEDPVRGEVVIVSDDEDEGEVRVALEGNVQVSCLSASLSAGANTTYRLDFGNVTVGKLAERFIALENCSQDAPLSLDAVVITNDDGGVFALDAASVMALPSSLSPGESAEFAVTYTPSTDLLNGGMLQIESNDASAPTSSVELRGKGTDVICPDAEALAMVMGQPAADTITAAPLSNVSLDSSMSDAAGGDPLARFEWTIISAPPESTSRLTPSASVSSPNLFLDRVGTYVIELTVYNQSNQPSCSPDRVVIHAQPEQSIYVEMFWDTPADPDQLDNVGSDMDLHYHRQGGAWNAAPDDVYWGNTTAEWSLPGAADDPFFLFDDGDGAGPEAVRQDSPSSMETYDIGVFYSDDRGFGPSHATVNVYLFGQLTEQLGPQTLDRSTSQVFWLVGTLDIAAQPPFVETPAGSRTASDFPQ